MDLFLSILEEKESKTLLFEAPPSISSLGLDVEKLRGFFQHEQEYEGLKQQTAEYERGVLELNERLSFKTAEFNRKFSEFEALISAKNEEISGLNDNIQATLNANIELERDTVRLTEENSEKTDKIRVLEDNLKHYESTLLAKNEELKRSIEKNNAMEEEIRALKNKLETLQDENSELKEKEFRNQILQDQNEEIMRTVKGIIVKSSKELSKGLENVDIKEDLRRLEAETTSDFSLFIQEVERFLGAVNGVCLEHMRGQIENIR